MKQQIYAVYKQNRIIASGSLQQCWLYLFNSEESELTVAELAASGTYIAPYNQTPVKE